jgi:hypothetical protein
MIETITLHESEYAKHWRLHSYGHLMRTLTFRLHVWRSEMQRAAPLGLPFGSLIQLDAEVSLNTMFSVSFFPSRVSGFKSRRVEAITPVTKRVSLVLLCC